MSRMRSALANSKRDRLAIQPDVGGQRAGELRCLEQRLHAAQDCRRASTTVAPERQNSACLGLSSSGFSPRKPLRRTSRTISSPCDEDVDQLGHRLGVGPVERIVGPGSPIAAKAVRHLPRPRRGRAAIVVDIARDRRAIGAAIGVARLGQRLRAGAEEHELQRAEPLHGDALVRRAAPRRRRSASLAASAACTCFRPMPLRSGQNSMRSSRFSSVTGPKRMISTSRPGVDTRPELLCAAAERWPATVARRARSSASASWRRALHGRRRRPAGRSRRSRRASHGGLRVGRGWRVATPMRRQREQTGVASSQRLQEFHQRVAVLPCRARQRRRALSRLAAMPQDRLGQIAGAAVMQEEGVAVDPSWSARCPRAAACAIRCRSASPTCWPSASPSPMSCSRKSEYGQISWNDCALFGASRRVTNFGVWQEAQPLS